jgi:hypothetical protein
VNDDTRWSLCITPIRWKLSEIQRSSFRFARDSLYRKIAIACQRLPHRPISFAMIAGALGGGYKRPRGLRRAWRCVTSICRCRKQTQLERTLSSSTLSRDSSRLRSNRLSRSLSANLSPYRHQQSRNDEYTSSNVVVDDDDLPGVELSTVSSASESAAAKAVSFRVDTVRSLTDSPNSRQSVSDTI